MIRLSALLPLLAALLATGLAQPALAQSTATPTVPGVLTQTQCNPGTITCYQAGTPTSPLLVLDSTYSQTGTTTLSASTTTANVALPASGSVAKITNGGSVLIYVNLGVGSSTTATSNNVPIPAGQTAFMNVGSATYLAALTASSTATVTVAVGNLVAVEAGGGSGGIQPAPLGVTTTNAAGTVTLGGTFQSVLAASATRKGCLIQNPTTATEALFVFFGANASATTATSITLGAGGWTSCNIGPLVKTDNVSVTAATTNHPFYAESQ